MNTPRFISLVLTWFVLSALLASPQTANGGDRAPVIEVEDAKAAVQPVNKSAGGEAPGPSGSETGVIMVNGRLLAGPNTSAQQRGSALFLPVTTIAHALGDVIQLDLTSRIVTVRRQNGIVADFSAQLNQVRENGSVTLTVSGSADIVFSPEVQELMLPVEIVAALLDVSVRRDEGRAITITRGLAQAETVRAGAKHRPWELFQVEYDYNLSHYSSLSNHNLTLRGTGRVADSRFTFLTNFVGPSPYSQRPDLQGGSLSLERPNGQSFVVGDFGTGTDLQLMSTTVRGASAELPVGSGRLNLFAGRSISGVLNPVLLEAADLATTDLLEQPGQPRRAQMNFDTNVFGAYVTAGSYTPRPNGSALLFSSGVMHFSGPNRRGDLLTGSVRLSSGRSHLQADLGAGEFSGHSRDDARVDGADASLNLAGSLQVTDQLVVQGKYAYVGSAFLSAQSGLLDPIKLAAGGVTWQPKKWLTTSLSGSAATRPGKAGDFNQFMTATVNVTPRRGSSLFFSHTQNSTTQLKDAAFTLASAAKDFSRWRLFVNATRVKTFGPAALNAQAGGSIRINESNTLEVSQAAGSRGLVNGTASWQLSSLFSKRLSISGGLGYMRSENSSLRTTEHITASARLPRQSVLQFSYLQNQTGPSLLISLRGLLLSSRRAESALNGPVAAVNSYGAVYGRVYQDVNLNGQFDPNTDQPQANVKVRVDGNRYVLTGADGNFHIDNIPSGEHAVYLELLSVRADLTLLDGAQQEVSLVSARDSVVDFRLVRTGRLSGMVWMDLNENGRLDEGEQPLSDVRVVTGSGRDTLTDANGYFLIGDLPPGEHVILVDEKTLPDQTRSIQGSLTVKVLAGRETENAAFPVTALPPEVKRFPSK